MIAEGASALILMYHRVNTSNADPFALSVTPERFAEHLSVIGEMARPVRLRDLTASAKILRERSIVITIDDGYADNLEHGLPILERFDVPATVFIATGYTGANAEFWWDELERVLEPGRLPDRLHIEAAGARVEWQSAEPEYTAGECRRHEGWRFEDDPPGERQALYLSLWTLLQPLSEPDRQLALEQFRAATGSNGSSRHPYRTLTAAEVKQLARNDLVEIGAHTVTHPPLWRLARSEQHSEIQGSKLRLEEIIGKAVTSFSYPYGSRSDETPAIVRECGFERACSSIRSLAEQATDPFLLPRVQVENWDGHELERRLTAWFANAPNAFHC